MAERAPQSPELGMPDPDKMATAWTDIAERSRKLLGEWSERQAAEAHAAWSAGQDAIRP